MLVSCRHAAARRGDRGGAELRGRSAARAGAPSARRLGGLAVAPDGGGLEPGFPLAVDRVVDRDAGRARPSRERPSSDTSGRPVGALTAASPRSRAAGRADARIRSFHVPVSSSSPTATSRSAADHRDRPGVPADGGERAEPAADRRPRPAGTGRRARGSRPPTASRPAPRWRCSARGPARRPASDRCTASSRARTARRARARRAGPRAGSRCRRHSRLASENRENTPAKARPSTMVSGAEDLLDAALVDSAGCCRACRTARRRQTNTAVKPSTNSAAPATTRPRNGGRRGRAAG